MEITHKPDDAILQHEIEAAAQALSDSIHHRSSRETGLFLNSLPDNVLKGLFSTSSDYQDGTRHGNPSGADNNTMHTVKELLPLLCEKGDVASVLLLLNYGVNPCVKGSQGTPLELASLHNHRPIIEKLLSWNNKAVDASQVKSCLAHACEGGHNDLVTFWLDYLVGICDHKISCADFDANNDPVVAACKGGNADIAARLLQDGVSYVSKDMPMSSSETLADVLDVWVEDDMSDDKCQLKKLVAKWTKKNLHVFDQTWLCVPRYTGVLISIDLSHNALKTVPGELLWGLPWLEKLTITHNALNKIPPPASIRQLENLSLKSLNLSHNHLKTVPAEIFQLRELEYLSLADNHIHSINPAHIQLTFIPEEGQPLWKCRNLKRLVLSHNRLLKIPLDIRVASQLTSLDISHNKLKDVPPPWDCPMEDLILPHNNITDVPDMHACWHKTLKYLNLGHNQLTEIPWTICRLQSLIDLRLCYNNIWRLPSISEWSIYNLQQLDLAGNLLVHMDSMRSRSMSTASSLSQSSTDETKSRHSSTASDLGKRKTSTASDQGSGANMNQPISPTSSSNFFIGLEPADQMLLFPSSFHTSIKSLDLSCNQLQDVPDSVCEMQSLRELYLNGNPGLTHLSEKLALLKNLYMLKLDPDQIHHPPEVSIVMKEESRPTPRIMQVLLEKLYHCQPYRGLKMMIVGPEKCGKTSLLGCLTNSDWPECDRGVNIRDWRLSKSKSEAHSECSLSRKLFKRPSQEGEDDIIFTIWDLKGGETYSVIHQTLFTPHTLYLLVWDVRDKEEGIEKLHPWILNIQAQAPESSIIAVGTHLDKLPSKSDHRQRIIESLHQSFRQAFPRLHESCVTQKGFVEVQATNSNGAGIQELTEAIYNCAASMMFKRKNKKMESFLVGRKVPSDFIILRERVKSESAKRQSVFPPMPPIMTEAQLTNHIRTIPQYHINSVQDLQDAVEFLRDSGILVHVGDHTYGLTNLYFLDPAWLCSVLLAVAKLKDKTINNGDGMVAMITLEEQCEECGFGRDKFQEYLQLLARFEIALPVSLKKFLIPSLLPKIAPAIEHTRYPVFNQKLQRWYKMAYIPPGFWSRLVSRMMVNIRQMDQKLAERRKPFSMRKPSHGSLQLRQTHTTVWQEGIFVQYDAGQIKVQPMQFPNKDTQGIKVTVRCKQGIFKSMGFVVDHIETLLEEWYPGLNDQNQDTCEPLVERLIPCPVCDDLALQNEDPDLFRPASDDIHIFFVKDLVLSATLKGQEHIQCPLHKEKLLSLKQLLPDVFMVDLNVCYLREEKIDIGPRLGQGGFGEVFKAEYNGELVAVKRLLKNQEVPVGIEIDEASSREEQELSVIYNFPMLRSEVAMMSRLKHPCIVKLLGVSIQRLSFAMEFAPLGDLDSYISRKCKELVLTFVSEKTVHRTILPRMVTYKIVHQIAMAIQYLHRMRVIHTDLKTDNILMCSVDPADAVNVKLADYGISHMNFAGGVKGASGFHAFCAPEILNGKAFDEKVDWFSFGMLIYHLMCGHLPFYDLQSSIETKATVIAGERPKLTFPDYTILPRFAHMEGMMNWCWHDSPADRPDKQDVRHCLRDASFLCLRHWIELETEPSNCLYSPTSSQTEEDKIRQYRMWLWKGTGEDRSYTKFNIEHSAQMRPKDCQGIAVTSAIQVGALHILGTIGHEIQVYGIQGTGRQLFTHIKNLQVTANVLCLCYRPIHMNTEKSRTIGHLFAGLEDGTIVIFVHLKSKDHSRMAASDLMQLKVLTLSTIPKPCICMQLIPEKQELWIGCGNIIRILSTQELLLEPIVIKAASGDKQVVKELAYREERVWCFINESFQVLQFNVNTRMWEDTLQCGSVTPSKGQCLSNPVTAEHPLNKINLEEEAKEEVGGETSGSCGDLNTAKDSDTIPVINELEFHEDHFKKPTISFSHLRKLGNRSSMPATGCFRKRRTAVRRSRPVSDGAMPMTAAGIFAKVKTLLVVKDTLWIGRDTGDIIIVNVDKDSLYDYRYGEVIAVLTVQSFLGWPHGAVKQLLPVGSDRVVACRDVVTSNAQLKHQLLVWENWGCKEVYDFEEMHYRLEKAKKGVL